LLRMRTYTLAALGLVPLLGLAAYGSDLDGKDPRTGKTPPPVPAQAQPAEKESGSGCAGHGTTVDFYKTPQKAADIAKRLEKLVFVLHVSGSFEDPRFT
jgi:hypothetical protein